MDTTDTSNASAGAKDEPKDPLSEPQIERFGGEIGPRNEIVIAQSPEGVVTALNGMTGAPLWRWKTGVPSWPNGAASMSLAYDGKQVYVSMAASDRPTWVEVDPPPGWRPQGGPNDSRSRAFHIRTLLTAVTALSAHDGAVRWRITRYISGIGERIYLDGSSLITTMLSFDDKALEAIALDCATGALRWSRAIGPLADPFGYFARPQLLWADAGQAAIALDTRLTRPTTQEQPTDPPYALLDTAADGAIIWRGDEAPESTMNLRRSTSGGVTFQHADHRRWPHDSLRAVRLSDGAELWRIPQSVSPGMLPVAMDLVAHEGQVFLLSHSEWTPRVHALEASSGREMWRWRAPRWLIALWLLRQAWRRIREAQRMDTWGAVFDDTLHARWRRPVRPNVAPALEVAHGRVYVATYLGVFARRVWDGHRLWHALPLTVANKLYIARDDREPTTF